MRWGYGRSQVGVLELLRGVLEVVDGDGVEGEWGVIG